jgi:hypothetical protein
MRLKLSIFCVLAGLLLCASSALAGQARLFTGSFGGISSTVPDPYPLSDPSSVAVDYSSGLSSGDVYVADPNNHRVEKFDATGHFILMFGKDVTRARSKKLDRVQPSATCAQPSRVMSARPVWQAKNQVDSRVNSISLLTAPVALPPVICT